MRISYLIERILDEVPATRNSDKELIIEFLDRRGFGFTEHQKQLFKDVSTETIRRIRQKLQEGGKYLADEKIRRHRRFKSLQVQQSIPKTKPDKVDNLIDNRLFDMPIKRKLL